MGFRISDKEIGSYMNHMDLRTFLKTLGCLRGQSPSFIAIGSCFVTFGEVSFLPVTYECDFEKRILPSSWYNRFNGRTSAHLKVCQVIRKLLDHDLLRSGLPSRSFF